MTPGRHPDHPRADPVTAPYGSWRSPIDIELVAGSALRLSEPRLDGDDIYWLESRPTEQGRSTLIRRSPGGTTVELTPAPFRVGSRVHEYGGGSYIADRRRVIASSQTDGRLWHVDPAGSGPTDALTPPGPWRYADLRVDPVRPIVYAVRETHDPVADLPATVRNELVAMSLDGSDGAGRVLVTGLDFVSSPRPSLDGRWLAWLEWDHPDMPWDATRLRVADLTPDGTLAEARTVAGGPDLSTVQPEWSPEGVLHFVSDETGWWNLYALDGADGVDGAARGLAPMEAELADPAWVFGRSSYGFAPDGGILAVARANGRDRFIRIALDGTVESVDSPITEAEGLQVAAETAVVVAAGPREGAAITLLSPVTGERRAVLARSVTTPINAAVLPDAEAIAFPTTDGATARALYFAPTNDAYRGPHEERPPLIVMAHGGPTSAASSSLSLDRAFFTSRGIAVVDVDYRGSTGYGRPYRDALKGRWGIADVDDCIAAAAYLAERGSADPARMAIRGPSAGGYTALAALAFRPEVFAAGISHYGIADLELIHIDGHKFESRYDEGMIASWPEGRHVFRERSPIHSFDRVRVPVLIFQGLDDKVVPPSQVESMEAALLGRGVPHVVMRFEGEGHGFRRAETRRATYATELSFLGRVFGFVPADELPPLEVPGLP